MSSLSESINLHDIQAASWSPQSISVSAELRNTVTGERTACVINLMDYIGKDSTAFHRLQNDPAFATEGHRHPVIFPDLTDYEKETRTILAGRLKNLCAREGFALTMKGWDSNHLRMVFSCQRKRIAAIVKNETAENEDDDNALDQIMDSNKRKKKQTPLPLSCEHLCKCGFQLSFKTKENAWVFKAGTGTPVHSFHGKMAPEEICIFTKYRDPDELKDAKRKRAFQKWNRPGYSSQKTFAPLMEELCASADRSFEVHEYVRETLSNLVQTIKEMEENDDNGLSGAKRSSEVANSASNKKAKDDPV